MEGGDTVRTFADNAGRTWAVAINVDAIKRVRDLLSMDLLEILDGKLIEKLYRDPVLLCDVVYAVCKPEADARNVTDEDFGRAMAGDAIEHATKALLEDLVGFSPSPRDRANLRRILETTWNVMDKARDVVKARLATLDADQIVAQALAT
ncbi:MAG TPA: hypothetical protein VFH17_02695, partial [Coriobacteriia bacterium]|nr:hypothetical protein [Coriobacteriia bacterium]